MTNMAVQITISIMSTVRRREIDVFDRHLYIQEKVIFKNNAVTDATEEYSFCGRVKF